MDALKTFAGLFLLSAFSGGVLWLEWYRWLRRKGAVRRHASQGRTRTGCSWDFTTILVMGVLVACGFGMIAMSMPKSPKGLSELDRFSWIVQNIPELLYMPVALPGIVVLVVILGVHRASLADLGLSLSQLRSIPQKMFVAQVWFVGISVVLYFIFAFSVAELFQLDLSKTGDDPTMLLLETASPLFVLLIATILAPLSEELFFRGILYPLVASKSGILVGCLVTGILFSAVHPGQEWLGFGVRAVLGVTLAKVYENTGSLWVPIILHSGYNFAIYGLFLLAQQAL